MKITFPLPSYKCPKGLSTFGLSSLGPLIVELVLYVER